MTKNPKINNKIVAFVQYQITSKCFWVNLSIVFAAVLFIVCLPLFFSPNKLADNSSVSYSSSQYSLKFLYVGSLKSDRYHKESCHYVNFIADENMVFFETIEEAESRGYSPCLVCKP